MKKIVKVVAVAGLVVGTSGFVTAHADTIKKHQIEHETPSNRVENIKKNSSVNYKVHTTREITQLSAMYESNNNPGSISNGNGDFGGKSYGAWQFSSNTGSLTDFMRFLKRENYNFYNYLIKAEYGKDNIKYGKDFNKAWKTIAKYHRNEFYNLQMEFIKENYYDKLVRMLRREGGFSKMLSSLAVQNVLVSTAVQNGVLGAYRIIEPLKYTDNKRVFIEKIYKRRAKTDSNGVLVNFYSSSNSIQTAIKNRLNNEEKTALSML